jgi:predicted lysophospholipase L1 biosynthesis ABC-type transport system permease subunit
VRYQVIGLTEELRLADAVGADRPSVFVPMPPRSGAELALALRLQGDVEAFVPRLQALAAEIDPDFALAEIGSFAERRARANEWAQMVLGMFAPLGVLALVLATTGLSALLGSLVNERIREIGLRRALGASGANVGRGLLGGLGLWGAAGALLGIAAAVALVDPLSQSLYGESQVGAVAISATLIVLLLALAVGVAGPLGRALRIDPLTALRSD